MKKTNLLLVTIFICLFAGTVSARNLAVALSPYRTKSEAKTEAISLTKFMTRLQPGDRVTLFDGYNLSIIGEFNIPADPAYKNPKARLNVNRGGVGALMRFAKNVSPPGTEGHPDVNGALRLPQSLHYAANNFMDSSGGLDLILLGSPLHDDHREPIFSMANGAFPSDGHLTALQGTTPYSAVGYTDWLKDVRVHIGYGDKNVMHSTQHGHFVTRFWTLYVEQLGGKLISFEGNLPTLFKRIKRNAIAPKHSYVAEKTSKLEMIQLPPQVTAAQSIYDRPLSTRPLTRRQIRQARQVEIGVSWACRCDIDLYARPTPNTQVLSYSQTSSAQGRYWKDYRNSPKPINGFETIAFHVPLDLRVLQIALNFYEGSAPQGVSVEVRLSIDGETYASKFHIPATVGNKGRGVLNAMDQGNASNPQTILIDPLRILKSK